MSLQHTIGIIGYGYLGRSLHRALAGTGIEVACIFNRSAEPLANLNVEVATTEAGVFMATLGGLDLVVELAHPDVSRSLGERILGHTDYMPCSVAALADDALQEAMIAAAAAAGTRLLVPHGAVVGIDNLKEARDNWRDVSITFRKPPGSIDMAEEPEDDETVLFAGSVREIAKKFPRNVNAMVACALATVGVDRARAYFVADRRLDNTLRGEFEFTGKDGSRLSIIKEEPAAGVSSTGMVASIVGSVQRALAVGAGGMNFV